MKKLLCLLVSIILASCSSDEKSKDVDEFIRGADMSFLPLIESEGIVYKNNNVPQDALITLKNAGCNAIRIRLWNNPTDGNSVLHK